MKKIVLNFSIFFLIFYGQGFANNITVSKVTIGGQNTTDDFCFIRFNLSWENSWRYNPSIAPGNWDAAWVFIKFMVGSSDITLTGASSSGQNVTVGSTANLRVGMVVRVTGGTGTIQSTTSVTRITSITNNTTFVLSAAPSPALSGATIVCSRVWEHVYLNSLGHTGPPGSVIQLGLQNEANVYNATTNRAVGVFVYSRDNRTNTTFSPEGITLRWNYGLQSVRDNDIVSVQVFAFEMVNIPEGANVLGSGNGTNSTYNELYTWPNGTPYTVTSEAAIPAGTLGTRSNSIVTPIGDNFPKGYAAFYIQKYEVSQQMYADFLNNLPPLLASFRYSGTDAAMNNPNASTCSSPTQFGYLTTLSGSTYVTGAPFRPNACTHAVDYLAFADWSATRPISEFEFEKACRGSVASLNEFAWGDFSMAGLNGSSRTNPITLYSFSGVNSSSESISANYSTTKGNCICNEMLQNGSAAFTFARVGIAAANTLNNNSRLLSGASYYGVMDLTGNVSEWASIVSTTNGTKLTRVHGDGELGNSGQHNTPSGWQQDAIETRQGYTEKGGDIAVGWQRATVSYRNISPSSNYTRFNRIGFRIVRTAPSSSPLSF